MPYNIKYDNREVDNYNPTGEEYDVCEYLKERIPVLKETKKNILGSFDFEQLMRDADREYIPHNLRENKSSSIMLVQDEVKGLRGSRVVPIGDTQEDWRSNVSEPVLLSKIQTALSILVDQNPEATFKALNDKFKKNTQLAYGLWKRSWAVAKSKHQMKLIIGDLGKYGWAVGRTYPRYISRKGKVLTEINDDHPEKNKYEEVEIVQYNDIFRERLDPYKTWIDDMANMVDPFSTSDWYYEKDYSWDSFLAEFGNYKNVKYVKKGGKEKDEDEDNSASLMRDDIVTVGFYESVDKDLYCIRIPSQDIVLYYSPLPNDKKKLSLWWTVWNIRDPKTPYGIGLYEIMRNDKVLYDRVKNMTVDQLVMAIYPMLFYSGAGGLTNQGDMTISPAVIKQKAAGTTIEQTKIDYDQRGWESLGQIREQLDEITGITPTLAGASEAKTLGQALQDKEGSLKKLSIPLKNISQMLEEEAFISLSWMKQIYSIPEIKKFANEEDIQAYVDETGRLAQNVATNKMNEETGMPEEMQADFFPQLELGLEDRDGELVESKENRFFNLGTDIGLDLLDWEGMIEVKYDSMLSPTPELERQQKTELFNIAQPVIAQIAMAIKQDVDMAIALAKPLVQLLEAQNEKPKLWLPDELIRAMEDPEAYKAELQQKQMAEQQMMMDQQAQAEQKSSIFLPAKKGGSVVPPSQVSNPVADTMQGMGKMGV
jgi:hypothetical protein